MINSGGFGTACLLGRRRRWAYDIAAIGVGDGGYMAFVLHVLRTCRRYHYVFLDGRAFNLTISSRTRLLASR